MTLSQARSAKITSLHIEGMRCIEDLTLELDGLTVLIGPNGSGKSTIIEAFAILESLTELGHGFYDRLHSRHGGLSRLLRHGAHVLELGVSLQADGVGWQYSFSLGFDGDYARIVGETLTRSADGSLAQLLFHRDQSGFESHLPDEGALAQAARSGKELVLATAPRYDAGIDTVRRALAGVEVHVPFLVHAEWASRETKTAVPARSAGTLEPTDRLRLLGTNLASAYHALKNDFGPEHWTETMELIQLGLSHDIQSVDTVVEPGGGAVGVSLLSSSAGKVPAATMSDGQLAYLGLVAAVRLSEGRSLLALDEPDLHLHPFLAARVMNLLASASEQHPVVVATHSDHLLDSVPDPAASVVVLAEETPGSVRASSLDAEALAAWREDYRGVGSLRAAGHLGSVLRFEE